MNISDACHLVAQFNLAEIISDMFHRHLHSLILLFLNAA